MSKKIIAITGGIGSGKSLAAKFLREAGYKVVSCDEITAELYKKRRVKKGIGKIFPSAVSGKIIYRIDKKIVSNEVFSDDEKRNRLNSYLHPLIIGKALKKAKSGKGDIAFVEIPLLFESESEGLFDGVIVILRDKDKRIEAVKKRAGISGEDVIKRIEKQFDYEAADLKDYVVINNGEGKDALREKILKAVKNF